MKKMLILALGMFALQKNFAADSNPALDNWFAAQAKVKTGKLSQQPTRSCVLPQTLRVEVASQQHYGVTMTRGVNQPGWPVGARLILAARASTPGGSEPGEIVIMEHEVGGTATRRWA